MDNRPSETQPEAARTLHLGDFADSPTLNLSEARIILAKSLEARIKRQEERFGPQAAAQRAAFRETETLTKTRDYLEIFATFKEMGDAEAAERYILERRERMLY